MLPSGVLAGCLSAWVCLGAASVDPVPWTPGITTVERIVYGPAPLDPFRRPIAVAIDPERGVFAVADAGNHRLVLFDETGRARGNLVVPGDGPRSGEPQAVAVDDRGRLFVLDGISHRIHVLNARGSILAELHPEPPAEAGPEAHPRDLAVGTSGRIYVLYAGPLPGVVVLDPRGETESRIGFGSGRPPLQAPVSLAVSPDEERFVVTDPPAKHQVLVFGRDGSVVRSFGAHEEAKGGFSLAVHAAWGPEGTLWVTDTIRHSISVFSAGSFLTRMGGQGFGPGQFDYPAACGFLAPDRVVVVERAGTRFQILGLTPPVSAEESPGGGSPQGLTLKEETQR